MSPKWWLQTFLRRKWGSGVAKPQGMWPANPEDKGCGLHFLSVLSCHSEVAWACTPYVPSLNAGLVWLSRNQPFFCLPRGWTPRSSRAGSDNASVKMSLPDLHSLRPFALCAPKPCTERPMSLDALIQVFVTCLSHYPWVIDSTVPAFCISVSALVRCLPRFHVFHKCSFSEGIWDEQGLWDHSAGYRRWQPAHSGHTGTVNLLTLTPQEADPPHNAGFIFSTFRLISPKHSSCCLLNASFPPQFYF